MRKHLQLSMCFVAVLTLQSLTMAALAQEGTGTHILDGTTVDWTYNNSDARMVVTFTDGLGEYEWVEGGRKGNSDSEIPYSSREISENIFLMSWIQADRPDFITMIFDFNSMTIATTGLIGYKSEKERVLFLDGVINDVRR